MGRYKVYAAAGAVGFVAGLRAMTAPAVVSRGGHSGHLHLRRSGLGFLGSHTAARTFAALATGERIADKTPGIPARTQPFSLAFRIASGGLCGAAVCAAKRKPVFWGVVAGGVAAAAGTYAGYELRRLAVRKLHVPDPAVAVVEDALAAGAAAAALRAVE